MGQPGWDQRCVGSPDEMEPLAAQPLAGFVLFRQLGTSGAIVVASAPLLTEKPLSPGTCVHGLMPGFALCLQLPWC